MKRLPRILAIDTGGTMTDTIVVDEIGNFTIGKAQTTMDESDGVLQSFEDALNHWKINLNEGAKNLLAIIYSGTTVLNKILTRSGEEKIGLIVTAGFEDLIRMGRGIQSYVGYSYPDRLHSVSHKFEKPIIKRTYIRGVRGRINVYGEEMIPLYEDEVEDAINDLLSKNVCGICVSLLFSFRNPSHELMVEKIAKSMMKRRSHEIPIFLSSKFTPTRGELPRTNTLLLEPYAAEPSRAQIVRIRDRLRQIGSKAPLRILTSYGGTIPPEDEWLVPTIVSGPIGGLIGAKYLANALKIENVCCCDVGGTSFDAGLITEGNIPIEIEPAFARLKLSIPSISLDSIGAGTGTFVNLDRITRRIELSDESAGYKIGTSYEAANLSIPTINDCNLILGYINPDYFLGGRIKLNPERALKFLKEKISEPLEINIYDAAFGIVKLIETQMRNHINSIVLGKGYAPENYFLLCYGGGGPLHVAGFTDGLNFQDTLIPMWAPAFSAFGCACSDYQFRYDRQIDMPLNSDFSNYKTVTAFLNAGWQIAYDRIREEIEKAMGETEVKFVPCARIQYLGMLDDLEVTYEKFPIKKEGLEELIRRFEDVFEKIYTSAAKTPESGYLITRAIGIGVVKTEKPVIKKEKISSSKPIDDYFKAERQIYWEGKWENAKVFDMDKFLPGNEINGPAILEHPATTFLIPKGYISFLDEYKVFHLRRQ